MLSKIIVNILIYLILALFKININLNLAFIADNMGFLWYSWTLEDGNRFHRQHGHSQEIEHGYEPEEDLHVG